MQLSTGAINSILDIGVYSTFNTFFKIYMYSGGRPESPDDIAPATLLCTLSQTGGASRGPAANRLYPISGSWEGVPASSGEIVWFRLKHSISDTNAASTTEIRIDGSCSESVGDIILSDLTVISFTGTVTVDEIMLSADTVSIVAGGAGTLV